MYAIGGETGLYSDLIVRLWVFMAVYECVFMKLCLHEDVILKECADRQSALLRWLSLIDFDLA